MKKFFYVIVVVLLVGLVVNIYCGINGNPLYINQAEKDMKIYLKKTYPDKDFKLGKVYYSMSFGSYTSEVTSPSDPSLSFRLSWRSKAKVFIDEYSRNLHKNDKDDILSQKFSSEISKDVKTLLSSQISDFDSVNSEISIPSGKYDANISYSKDLNEKPILYICMKGDKISKDNFVDRCIKIRDMLIQNGYKFNHLSIQYNANFKGDVKGGGAELYNLSIDDKLLSSSKNQLLKSKNLYENTGKGKMILSAFLYKGAIAIFVLAVIAGGIIIGVKEKTQKHS